MAHDLSLPGLGRDRAIWMDILISKMPQQFKALPPRTQAEMLNGMIDQIVEALDAAYTIGVRDGGYARKEIA